MQLLTTEGDYGLRAIIFLACRPRGKTAFVSEIAQDQMIPVPFLFKILRKLVKKGIVKSFRGPNGGYALAKNPSEISFLDVIETIDGPLTVNRCLSKETRCILDRSCKMFGAWHRIQDSITHELQTLTIADLLKPADIRPQEIATASSRNT